MSVESVEGIDFSRPYYVEYYDKINELKDLILEEYFNPKTNLKISWNIDEDSGCVLYAFKKLPRDEATVPKTKYCSETIEQFGKDDNILAFSKITLPSNQHVGEHIDTKYWPKEFFRAHIPLEDTEAIFYYGEEEINWKKGELYFFDVRHIKHSAKNESDKDCEFISIDICVEDAK